MSSNRGFTIIEVLIASIILYLVVIILSAGYKQFVGFKLRQRKAEKTYIAVLSLKNKIEDGRLDELNGQEGKIDGLRYRIMIERIEKRRNYLYGGNKRTSGNRGNFIITLYKVTIAIDRKKFVFYETQFAGLSSG